MSHRIIYIEKCEYLRLYLDNLKIEWKDDELLIPVSDIQILVIDNYKSNLSIPLINKCLQLNIDAETYDDKYSRERPDFVFSNNDKSIGIEVVECRPSVMECKKKNEAERENFEKRICDEFKKNKFLMSITQDEGLNILIDEDKHLKFLNFELKLPQLS